MGYCLSLCMDIFSHEKHNEFVFYKSEKNQTTSNNNPSIKDLISDRNVKKALIHNSYQTVYVGHDDSGKAYYGEVNHKNEENANEFINNFIKGRNKLLLDD